MAQKPVRQIINKYNGVNWKADPSFLASNEMFCLYAKGVDFTSGKMISANESQLLAIDTAPSTVNYSDMSLDEILLQYLSDDVFDYTRLTDDRGAGDFGDSIFSGTTTCDMQWGSDVLRIVNDAALGKAFLVSGRVRPREDYIVRPRAAGANPCGFSYDSFSGVNGTYDGYTATDVMNTRVFGTDANTGRFVYATYNSDIRFTIAGNMCEFTEDVAPLFIDSVGERGVAGPTIIGLAPNVRVLFGTSSNRLISLDYETGAFVGSTSSANSMADAALDTSINNETLALFDTAQVRVNSEAVEQGVAYGGSYTISSTKSYYNSIPTTTDSYSFTDCFIAMDPVNGIIAFEDGGAYRSDTITHPLGVPYDIDVTGDFACGVVENGGTNYATTVTLSSAAKNSNAITITANNPTSPPSANIYNTDILMAVGCGHDFVVTAWDSAGAGFKEVKDSLPQDIVSIAPWRNDRVACVSGITLYVYSYVYATNTLTLEFTKSLGSTVSFPRIEGGTGWIVPVTDNGNMWRVQYTNVIAAEYIALGAAPSSSATYVSSNVFAVCLADGTVKRVTVYPTMAVDWTYQIGVLLPGRKGFERNTDYWHFDEASRKADFPKMVKTQLSQPNPKFDTLTVEDNVAYNVWPDGSENRYGISFVREYRGVRDESGLTFKSATNSAGANRSMKITRPDESTRLTWRGKGLSSPSWEYEQRAEQATNALDGFFPDGNTIAWNIYRLEDGEFRLVDSVPVFTFATGNLAVGNPDISLNYSATEITKYAMHSKVVPPYGTIYKYENTDMTLQYGSVVEDTTNNNFYKYIGTRVARYTQLGEAMVFVQSASPSAENEVENITHAASNDYWEYLGSTTPAVTNYYDTTTSVDDLGAIATTYVLAENGALYNLDALPEHIDGMADSLYFGKVFVFSGKTLYWSDSLLPHNFYYNVDASFSEDIHGVVVGDGTAYVVTEKAVHVTSSTSFFALNFDKVYDSGAVNKRSVCAYKGGVAFLSRKGVVVIRGRDAQVITSQMFPEWMTQKMHSADELCESTSAIGTDGDNLYISVGHIGVFKFNTNIGFTEVNTGSGFYGHGGFPQGFTSGRGWCVGRFLTPIYYYLQGTEYKWRMIGQTKVLSASSGKHLDEGTLESEIQTGEITLGRFGFKAFQSIYIRGKGDWTVVVLDADGDPLVYDDTLTRDGSVDETPTGPYGSLNGVDAGDTLTFSTAQDIASYEKMWATAPLYLSDNASGLKNDAYRASILYGSENYLDAVQAIYGVTTVTTAAGGWTSTQIPAIHSSVASSKYEADAFYWSIKWPNGSARLYKVYDVDGNESHGAFNDYFTPTEDFCMGDVLQFKGRDSEIYWLRYVGDQYIAANSIVRPAEKLARGMNPLLSADFVRCFPFKGVSLDFSTDEGSTIDIPFDERLDRFTLVLRGTGVIKSIEVVGEETV